VFVLVDVFFYRDTFFSEGGHDQDIYALGTVLFVCVLLVVTGKISLVTRYWTIWNHSAYFGGVVRICLLFSSSSPPTGSPPFDYQIAFFLVVGVCGSVFITFYTDAQALYGEAPQLFKSPQFYLTIVIVPVACLLKDFAWIL